MEIEAMFMLDEKVSELFGNFLHGLRDDVLFVEDFLKKYKSFLVMLVEVNIIINIKEKNIKKKNWWVFEIHNPASNF